MAGQALASPSLMIISSDDPIWTAFTLSYELRKLSFTEVEFKDDYIRLSRQCTKFAVDLLDVIRGSQASDSLTHFDAVVVFVVIVIFVAGIVVDLEFKR